MATTKPRQEVDVSTGEVMERKEVAVPEQPVQTSVGQSQANQFMSMIIQAGSDAKADVDKMDKMFALYEKVKAAEARVLYNKAMASAQGEMTTIEKKHKNLQTNSYYAKVEDIIAGIKPVLTKHGFSLSFSEIENNKEDEITVKLIISHDGGEDREFFATRPITTKGLKGNVNMTETHARQSAVTYAERAALVSALSLEVAFVGDDDGNSAGGKVVPEITNEQLMNLEARINEVYEEPSGAEKFINYLKGELKINQLKEIRMDRYSWVMNTLDKVVERRKSATV